MVIMCTMKTKHTKNGAKPQVTDMAPWLLTKAMYVI